MLKVLIDVLLLVGEGWTCHRNLSALISSSLAVIGCLWFSLAWVRLIAPIPGFSNGKVDLFEEEGLLPRMLAS